VNGTTLMDEELRLLAFREMTRHGYLRNVAKAGSKLARWHHYLEQLGHPDPAASSDPQVQPRIFPNMAGLRMPPWRDANQVPAAAMLEKFADIIGHELAVIDESHHMEYPNPIFEGGQWTILPLFVFGEQSAAFVFGRNPFPQTTNIVQNLPDVCADLPLADVIFSAHSPHTHLLPHCSWDPFRLRLHLGLEVPENCRLRVGNEIRHWQPGKVLAFHDAGEHEPWHDRDQRRVVLIVDLWHPDLTVEEREAMRAFFRKKEIRAALMRSRVPPELQAALSRKFAQSEAQDPMIRKYWDS
jgi:hypothetical protein